MGRLMTESEISELQAWTGPPPYFLCLSKANEVARLALHARNDGRVLDVNEPGREPSDARKRRRRCGTTANPDPTPRQAADAKRDGGGCRRLTLALPPGKQLSDAKQRRRRVPNNG